MVDLFPSFIFNFVYLSEFFIGSIYLGLLFFLSYLTISDYLQWLLIWLSLNWSFYLFSIFTICSLSLISIVFYSPLSSFGLNAPILWCHFTSFIHLLVTTLCFVIIVVALGFNLLQDNVQWYWSLYIEYKNLIAVCFHFCSRLHCYCHTLKCYLCDVQTL